MGDHEAEVKHPQCRRFFDTPDTPFTRFKFTRAIGATEYSRANGRDGALSRVCIKLFMSTYAFNFRPIFSFLLPLYDKTAINISFLFNLSVNLADYFLHFIQRTYIQRYFRGYTYAGAAFNITSSSPFFSFSFIFFYVVFEASSSVNLHFRVSGNRFYEATHGLQLK